MKLLCLAVILAAVAFGADSPIVGTWHLRLDRSAMRPHKIKTEKAVITQKDATTWHYVYDFEYTDGTTRHNEVDRVFDGKERPVAAGRVETSEHWDEFNWVSRQTENGKLTGEIHSTISADRKTQTVHRTTVTATETFKEEIVFERAN